MAPLFSLATSIRLWRSVSLSFAISGTRSTRVGFSSTVLAAATSSLTNQRIHVPVGNDGEGAYTAATKGCFDVIDAATPLVLEGLKHQSMPTKGDAFQVADFGTADGGTSLGLLSKVVRNVRERQSSDKQEIVIHYEDQSTNEWKSVFSHALGNIQVRDALGNPVECPFHMEGVFVNACGVSFHQQCYPTATLHLALSFTCMHWLSQSHHTLQGKPVMHAAQVLTNTKLPNNIIQAETEQAGRDWVSILEARTKELVVGGRFVCANFCVTHDGHFLGHTDVGVSMWDSFDHAWNQLYEEQGLIDETERWAVSFPNYYRTKQEFLDGVAQVPGLKVLFCEEKIVRCPYREQWRQEQLHSTTNPLRTAREYAESFVPTTRSWSHSTFQNALHAHRTEDDKERIMSQFWENYVDLVAQDPDQHGMDYAHCYLMLEKVSPAQ